jgi:uncharacterized protein (DUF934 family)
MALIIRHRKIEKLPEGERWPALVQWDGHQGVRLTTSDDLASLAAHLDRLAIVEIEFPQFTDGRGYSMARLLRERYGFRGEIRAVGEVLRDNLFYLSRCGFDSFVLSDQSKVDAALDGLADFSEGYQASFERPQPLFRRRAA